jgi:acetolactate synthase I/II/III large subunit
VNGAHALLATLGANDVTVCFANPGTSEMHFVAGLDDAPDLRGVLCLFEGVATGAADGYARASGRAAATLLHLGPGLANGWANLHNARRARVPILNIIGDHATYHARYDAPLQSDIQSLASGLNGWFRRCEDASHVARDAADAVAAAYGPPGRVATLVLPADASWGDVDAPAAPWPIADRRAPAPVASEALDRAARALRTKRSAIFVGGTATDAAQLGLAERIARSTESRVIMETFPPIVERGAGVASPERLIYLSEFAISQLADVEALILVGSTTPVGFFAYPDVSSELVSPGTDVIDLAPPGTDTAAALAALCEELRAPAHAPERGAAPARPTGALTSQSFAAAVGATLPEGIVVADESNTAGVHLFGATRFAPAHRWMTLTGGSIGFGLPVALGAAVATGGRVLALESDGSMMYTPQALWTMAREGLDVTVVGLANRSYAILNLERQRVGAVSDGSTSQRLLDLDGPALDLAGVAASMGVPSSRVTSAEDLVIALERSYATPGPAFIEAVLPKGLG